MRDADTPPQDPGHNPEPHTELPPRQRAALIRAAAAEVHARVQEWHNSATWQSSPTNIHRYEIVVTAIAVVQAISDHEMAEVATALADAVRPILYEWRASRPGPEQQIFVAVERLRRACG